MILTYLFVPCFLPILAWVAIAIGSLIIIIAISTKPDKKTTRIAILGLKASGKTTLWNGLRGTRFSSDYQVTAKDRVRSFTIEKGGKELTIEENSDIGGDNQWVRDYDDLIKDGTFVFYLVDATDKKSESRSDIRSRVQKICEHMQTMKNCGVRILITHIDKCSGMQRAEIISSIKEWLDLESVKINGKTAKYEYDAVNLTSASDIEYIKQMIIDNVYG
ncbi:MAG: ADP-ribosylation factor-like protein [Muribaculaceae bacterium]